MVFAAVALVHPCDFYAPTKFGGNENYLRLFMLPRQNVSSLFSSWATVVRQHAAMHPQALLTVRSRRNRPLTASIRQQCSMFRCCQDLFETVPVSRIFPESQTESVKLTFGHWLAPCSPQ